MNNGTMEGVRARETDSVKERDGEEASERLGQRETEPGA